MAKLKKKAEQERRLLKREGKRQARLNAKLMSKRKNSKAVVDKLSNDGDGNAGFAGGKGQNDGTKTEKSDVDELMTADQMQNGMAPNAMMN